MPQVGISDAVTVRVDAVIVVPMKAEGVAYAHTTDGRCVTLAGPRDQMVELCKRVKAATIEQAPAIHMDAGEFSDFSFLLPAECPVHDTCAA